MAVVLSINLRVLVPQAAAYIPLVKAIQEAVPFPLYAAIPQFLLSTPEPLQIGSKISDSKKAILAMGLNASSSPKFFYGAHSLGTVFLQSWVFSHASDPDMAGQILTGGSLLRKYRNGSR